ncbi:MAG: DUF4124 domain-containing protein [Betaproteobacteria bacterium]|jgi:hypothetical protein|nr:DUF4124 domain-containing protein [Betaproteobacteria bacterium]
MNPVPFLIGLSALLLVAVPAQAQLYKWVDANGRVQYSDRKPTDGRQQAQEVKNTVSSVGSQPIGAGTTSGPKTAAELDKEFQKRRQEQTEAQQKQQQAATEQKQKAQNCQAARENLAALNSGQRIARFNEKGEKIYIDDSARAAEVARSRQLVQANCN